MAARILNGFFSVIAATRGLIYIKDIYFFHEHPRKINIWATAPILAPFLGLPFTALTVQSASWRWAFCLVIYIDAVALLLTVAFLDETFWPRDGTIPTTKSRYLRLLGIEQWRTKLIPNTFFDAPNRPFIAILKLPVLISTVYYFCTFAWVIGNNITISIFIVPGYDFNYNQLAAIYVAPVLGGIIGQVAGHWVHDWIGHIYMRRHRGVIIPEAHLIIIWFVTPLYIIGMNLIGSTIMHHWHYMVLAVGWFLHNFSTIGLTTAIYAYVLDAYPEGSGEVSAWLNAWRTLGGFVVGYVQIIWAESQGLEKECGIQSAIVATVFSVVVFLQFFGPKLRAMQGPMNFKTQ
jgi:MFS family permease